MPVSTLFFQNLREDEKIRKSVLHALIERIQAYLDRKVKVKLSLELGKKLKGHQSRSPEVTLIHLQCVN